MIPCLSIRPESLVHFLVSDGALMKLCMCQVEEGQKIEPYWSEPKSSCPPYASAIIDLKVCSNHPHDSGERYRGHWHLDLLEIRSTVVCWMRGVSQEPDGAHQSPTTIPWISLQPGYSGRICTVADVLQVPVSPHRRTFDCSSRRSLCAPCNPGIEDSPGQSSHLVRKAACLRVDFYFVFTEVGGNAERLFRQV